MANYIDGFVLPIPRTHLNSYQQVSEKVAEIWKEHGALSYFEFVGNDMQLEGTLSFVDVLDAKENEVVIFGWVMFPSKEIRDVANEKVPLDPRMIEIVAPLTDASTLIFDASRMVFGGFQALDPSNI